MRHACKLNGVAEFERGFHRAVLHCIWKLFQAVFTTGLWRVLLSLGFPELLCP